ncbi:MAG: hypothetical protein Q4D98_12415 [Planctomycetia bacterium]|nr:hypothetical protein [Planctomycetia bacterium]
MLPAPGPEAVLKVREARSASACLPTPQATGGSRSVLPAPGPGGRSEREGGPGAKRLPPDAMGNRRQP